MDAALPKRKNLRLPDYSYDTPGAYFITFCTQQRRNTLSRIVGAIHESPVCLLSDMGKIVDSVIKNPPPHLNLSIDHYVIMPNHVHLLVTVPITSERAIPESPLQKRSEISKIVGYIKMTSSKAIRQRHGDIPVWQRGFYDHVIRNEQDYCAIANYINENPLRWKLDKLYMADLP